MPRRQPPSALILHPGPTPPRDAPKHVMPSIPRPAFCLGATTVSRARPTHRSYRSIDRETSLLDNISSIVGMPSDAMVYPPALMGDPMANGSVSSLNLPLTPDSKDNSRSWGTSVAAKPAVPVLRGPWDHSGTITAKLSLDVEALLRPLQPAAINYH